MSETQTPNLNYELELQPGNPVARFKLTAENFEQLMALQVSSNWKLYAKTLAVIKDGYTQSLLPLDEPNKITKTLGIIVGLNLALAQLGVLVADYKNKEAKRVDAETKKHPKPNR